jgi:ABC-type multidrug transport system fused ATPase/permease subunit
VSGLTGFWTGLMKGKSAIRVGIFVLSVLGVGAGTRVFHLLDRQSRIPLGVGQPLSPTRNGSIRFEKVSFTYPSRKEVRVLKDVSFEVERGTSVALV